jgi:hypothetical protein
MNNQNAGRTGICKTFNILGRFFYGFWIGVFRSCFTVTFFQFQVNGFGPLNVVIGGIFKVKKLAWHVFLYLRFADGNGEAKHLLVAGRVDLSPGQFFTIYLFRVSLLKFHYIYYTIQSKFNFLYA